MPLYRGISGSLCAETPIDSVIDVLKVENSSGRQSQLACAYLLKNDWSNADSVFDILDDDTIYTNFCKLQRMLHDYFPLSTANPDSLVPRLDSIASDTEHVGYAQARAVIFALTGKMYSEFFVDPELSGERKGRIDEKKFVLGESLLLTYPNLVSGLTTIEVHAPETGKCMILISDVFGRTIKMISLKNGNNKVQFDSSTLNTGVYFECLLNDDKIISTIRLLKTD